MNDTRSSKRVFHEMDGYLSCAGIINPCKVLNISLTGALVSIKDQLPKVPQRGDSFNLTLYSHFDRQSIFIKTRVAHHGFSLVGLEFVNPNAEIIKLLSEIIDQQTIRIYSRGTQWTDQCRKSIVNL